VANEGVESVFSPDIRAVPEETEGVAWGKPGQNHAPIAAMMTPTEAPSAWCIPTPDEAPKWRSSAPRHTMTATTPAIIRTIPMDLFDIIPPIALVDILHK